MQLKRITSFSFVNTDEPTSQPSTESTVMPTSMRTLSPTAQPSNSSDFLPVIPPRTFSSFYYYNNSCLSECLDYKESDFNTYDNMMQLNQSKANEIGHSICKFLNESVVGNCRPFSVLDGTCSIPSCSRTCDLRSWCYYAISSILECTYADSSIGFKLLIDKCVDAYSQQSSVVDNTKDNNKNKNNKLNVYLTGKSWN